MDFRLLLLTLTKNSSREANTLNKINKESPDLEEVDAHQHDSRIDCIQQQGVYDAACSTFAHLNIPSKKSYIFRTYRGIMVRRPPIRWKETQIATKQSTTTPSEIPMTMTDLACSMNVTHVLCEMLSVAVRGRDRK